MMPMVPQLKRLMVPLPMMIMVLRVLLIMTMLRAQLLLIHMVPQQLMMTMVLKVLQIMTMLMKVQLLTHTVPQLMKPMVLQLTMMFLPQNTAMLPDADVPDLAILADQPQLDLTETETVQLPEDQLVDDQLHKPQELEDSSDQLPRHQEDKLVPNNSKHQDVDVVEV